MKQNKFTTMFNSDIPNGITKEIQVGRDKTASYIPIEELECMLDAVEWGTKNFQYQLYKDGYANLCVAASLELEINYNYETGVSIKRTFVGACNFSLNSIEPNTHFLATAKSECIKNAASDIGKYFGRGLNNNTVPTFDKSEKKVVKSKPDAKIMQQFADAVANNDEATITMLTNIYNIKTD